MINEIDDEVKDMVLKIRKQGVKNFRILETFMNVNRKNFVLRENIGIAYSDSALPIGCNQTISQPYILARMLDLLELNKQDRVLEIGSGSGYSLAILSKLVREVVGYEIISDLREFAIENLSREGINNVSLLYGDGTDLSFSENSFDKILVSAHTGVNIPQSWFNVLEIRGLLVLPQEHYGECFLTKYQKKELGYELLGRFDCTKFVPLTGKYGIEERLLN